MNDDINYFKIDYHESVVRLEKKNLMISTPSLAHKWKKSGKFSLDPPTEEERKKEPVKVTINDDDQL